MRFCFFAFNRNDIVEFSRRWSRRLLDVLGIRLEAEAIQLSPGTLLVANHISWLDVLALNALMPAGHGAMFIAKAELRNWPLIGWLLERNGTLFLRRGFSRQLIEVNSRIAAYLTEGKIVAVFPEGTTSAGAGVLPFRPALFEPAVRGARKARFRKGFAAAGVCPRARIRRRRRRGSPVRLPRQASRVQHGADMGEPARRLARVGLEARRHQVVQAAHHRAAQPRDWRAPEQQGASDEQVAGLHGRHPAAGV